MRRYVSMASAVLLLALIPVLAWGFVAKNRTENQVKISSASPWIGIWHITSPHSVRCVKLDFVAIR